MSTVLGAASQAGLSSNGVAAKTRKLNPEDARNPTIWFVLALVIEQPSHGYEINQRYERRFDSLLHVSVPRVYGALERLRDARMIEETEIKLSGRTTKQHALRHSYRVTKAGIAAYADWIGSTLGDDGERPHLMGPIAAAGLLSVDVLLDAIDRFAERCRKELHGFDAGPAPGSEAPLVDVAEQLILDQRRRELEARRDWAVEAREILLERYEPRGRSKARPAVRKRSKR
jgi:DNA-binding PadR family transcriptional regulator